MIDGVAQFEDVRRRSEAAVRSAFPITSDKHTLSVTNLRWLNVGDTVRDDIIAQKEAKLKMKTFAAKLVGDVTLAETGGKKIDTKKDFVLLLLPHVTARASYIVDGNEVQTVNQLRLKPGPYTRFTVDNNTETFINAAGGGYRIVFNRETGVFRLKSGQTSIYLYPILKTMGVTDQEMAKLWGSELFDANKKHDKGDSAVRLYRTMRRYASSVRDPATMPPAELATAVQGYFESKRLDPEISKLTMGEGFDKITIPLLLKASQKALALSRGEVEEDDTESLAFKSVYSVEDFIEEKLNNTVTMLKRMLPRVMDRTPSISMIMSPMTLSGPVLDWFRRSEFTRYSNQQNPLDMAATAQLTTLMGEGGIQSEFAVADRVRDVHPSQMGFIDPVHSTEGCFGPASEVYTSVGWVRWDAVTAEHRLACLVDGHVQYCRPERLVSYHHTGTMVGYKSDRIEFFVTPNHRMWVRPQDRGAKYRFVSAQSVIGKNRNVMAGGHAPVPGSALPFVLPPVEAEGKHKQIYGNPPIGANLNKPVAPIDIVDWCRFLGWYLSEGNTRSGSAWHPSYCTTITQLHTSKAECAHIEDTLNQLPFAWSRGGDRRFRVSGKQLHKYLAPLGKSRTKHVPPEVFAAPPAARLAFLEAACMGDGIKRTYRAAGERGSNPLCRWERYSTTSKQLADDIYRLMFELGLSASLSFSPDKRSPKYLGCYYVNVHSFNERQLTSKNHRHPAGMYYTADYNGPVYCAEVPGGLMFCRHGDGMGFWIGNSRVGVTGHFTIGVRKQGTDIYTTLVDAKTGKRVEMTPHEIEHYVVAFPDQFVMEEGRKPKPVATEVKAKAEGKILMVPAAKVQYIYNDVRGYFSATTNAIPFVHTNHANRAMMADRHIEQAVPLVNPEAPLVQSRFVGELGYEQVFGRGSNVHAPVAGVVVKVGADHIDIKDAAGKTQRVALHHDYPLNGGVFLTDTPTVKSGDKVKKDQVIANNNFSKDGALALGVNISTAILPWHGWNYEDGYVVSESAAQALTSEHQHDIMLDKTPDMVIGLTRWLAHFPNKADTVDKAKYDQDGIVKKGTIVNSGDILIPAVEQLHPHEEYDYAKLHKAFAAPWRDASEAWDGHVSAEVIDVIKTPKFVRIQLKTKEPLVVGDKLSLRSGGKGIVATILPDKEMPQTKDGKPIGVLYNPAGIPGRNIPGLLFEGAAGKIAAKTGKTYLANNFDTSVAVDDKIRAELKQHGLSDLEDLHDPTSNRTLKDIFVGNLHIMKLQHQVRKKFFAKGFGSYTMDGQPTKIDNESAQNIGVQEIYALLASGAMHFLQDSTKIKSTSNPEYWRALQHGLPVPPPQQPFILDKFTAYLTGMGLNLKQDGRYFKALPVTDKDVLQWAKGEIDNPGVIRASDLMPEAGGLFDKAVTGGVGGTSWSMITLESPVPNPLMEKPITVLTGLKASEYTGVMNGTLYVTKDGKLVTDSTQGKAHGEGLKVLLSKIDVDRELADSIARVRSAKGATLDNLNKKRRYLQALKAMNLKPVDAYLQTRIPVIPPIFRPVYPMPNGALNVADANHTYREVLLLNNQIKDLKKLGVDDKNLAKMRADLYGAVQGVAGVTEPLTRGADFKGFLAQIKGRENKSGMFQGRMVRRPQDLSARSTAIPDPGLGIDALGLPADMGFVIYKPFLIQRLANEGHSSLEAGELIEKRDPVALRALKDEMLARPVYMNRAPSLHKFNMLAFKPTLVEGQAIHANPLIVKGFCLDFDGDQQLNSILCRLTKPAILAVKKRYGVSYVEDRKMTARLNLKLPAAKGGTVCLFNLEDFPHAEHLRTTDGTKGPIEWYATIPGTQVLAYDERRGRVVWAEVSLWSKHIDRLVEIVELESGRQIFADDDPRAVYGVDRGSLSFVRRSPTEAVRAHMWVPRAASIEEAPCGASWLPTLGTHGRKQLRDAIDLNFDVGYLLGALAGDGWVVHVNELAKGVALAYGDKPGDVEVLRHCERVVIKLFGAEHPATSFSKGGEYAASNKVTWTSRALASFVEPLIGSGAENKHLPPFYLSSPNSFRKGLFAGLMDTDGSISVSHAKKKAQLQANLSSRSLRLLQETKLLAATLSIDSRVTPTKTPAGLPFWVLSFSGPDVVRWGAEGMQHPTKLKRFHEGADVPAGGIAPRADRVPISRELARHLRQNIPAPRNAPRAQKTLYVNANQAMRCGATSREVANRLIAFVTERKILEHADGAQWLAIVRNTRVKWDQVTGRTVTANRQTGFDLTVPGFDTFMSVDGIILSNTVGIHVPVSEEARREAFDKFPSKQLFATHAPRLMHMPTAETSLGLYLMTAPKGTPVPAKSVGEMLARFQKKEIEVNASVSIGGKIWTPGQALLEALFPADSKPGNVVYTKNIADGLFYEFAKKHPQDAGDLLSKAKDLGNHYVTHIGFSIGLDDLLVDRKARDHILIGAAQQVKKVGFDAAYAEAVTKIKDLVKSKSDNRIVLGSITSGAFGKSDNVVQMLGAPVAVVDHKGRPIRMAITRNYAEGMDVGSYWATLPGARHGMVQKGLGTQQTGALAKRLLNTTVDTIISERDCGTTNGLVMPVDSRDALDRVVADGPYKGRTVDSTLVRDLKGRNIETLRVRSPLTCQSVKGLCALCYGLLETGSFPPTGYHIGVLAGQAVSEPVTQLSLKTFHTQATVGQELMGFNRIEQIYEMPDHVKGSATLAKISGKITGVKPSAAGGWFVDIGSAEHYIPMEVGLGVKKGDTVRAGQRLSQGGVIKPQELLGATGDISKVREQMINDLDQAYRGGGLQVRRKLFETVIRPMTNRAEVVDAGDGEKMGVFRGDVLSANHLDALNRDIKKAKGQPIRYESTLLSIRTTPFYGDDFVGKLMFERPHETLMAAPALGAKADTKGGHPITQHVFGSYVVPEKKK